MVRLVEVGKGGEIMVTGGRHRGVGRGARKGPRGRVAMDDGVGGRGDRAL